MIGQAKEWSLLEFYFQMWGATLEILLQLSTKNLYIRAKPVYTNSLLSTNTHNMRFLRPKTTRSCFCPVNCSYPWHFVWTRMKNYARLTNGSVQWYDIFLGDSLNARNLCGSSNNMTKSMKFCASIFLCCTKNALLSFATNVNFTFFFRTSLKVVSDSRIFTENNLNKTVITFNYVTI